MLPANDAPSSCAATRETALMVSRSRHTVTRETPADLTDWDCVTCVLTTLAYALGASAARFRASCCAPNDGCSRTPSMVRRRDGSIWIPSFEPELAEYPSIPPAR